MSAIRGEAKIYWKESKGVWACDINLGRKPNGKPNRVQLTAKNRNDLIKKRRDAIRQIEDGVYTPGSVPTVAAWWEHWLVTFAKPRVVPRVLANYRSYGNRHVVPHLGARRLNRLSTDDVRFLHEEMRKSGVSSRTVQAVHKTLSKALKDAVREGVIPANPCDRMDAPRASSVERGAFSVAEVKALLGVAAEDGPGTLSRWLMAFMSGARQGERLGLEWDRVDLDAGVVDLSWQVQEVPWAHGPKCGCGVGGTPARCPVRVPDVPDGYELRECYLGRWFVRPKTVSSKRAIPLPGPLWDALRAWREESTGEGLVWTDVRGRPVMGRDDRKEFRELCLRAGVRPLDVHSARHSMITLLAEAGVDSEVIRQMAGHSSILATRGYLHVSTDHKRAALDVLSGVLE